MNAGTSLRIAATADLHCTKTSAGAFQELFASASHSADVLLLCGDLTDYGDPEEARILAHEIRTYARIPVLGVLGNHDFESGHPSEVIHILHEAGVHMLEGASIVIEDVGFAGVCGFGGGFGRYMLSAWGEPLIKTFAHEAVEHAMHLERALARLDTPKRIAMLHYSPLRATVEGEPPEIFPFLGSSQLEGPLNRLNVTAAFHGHAHNGSPQGMTGGKTPVYNVAIPLLRRTQPSQPWFRIFEVEREPTAGAAEPELALQGQGIS